MELILQQNLPHQQGAVDSIVAAFEGVSIYSPIQLYENPHLSLSDNRLSTNIKDIQLKIPAEFRGHTINSRFLNLDIKMETGTGKTYVYTKTMFELHKKYGINKFIIVVPTLAIKAGTGQFLNDVYVRKHFRDGCGYGTEMEVGILDSPKSKKRRSYFPSVVSDFVRGSSQNAKKIYVMVTNMQLLSNAQILTKDNYDYGVEGFYKPLDAIKATRPFVIIDEPHRLSTGQKAYNVIKDDIQPQCIIRFGATFPEINTGKGKQKSSIIDFQNLIYNLNACDSFNQNLIKGVAKEHFEPPSKREEKIKVLSITSKTSVTFQYKKRDETTKTFTLFTGDSLSIISDALQGITIHAIASSNVEFSNGVIKSTGEEIDVDIYMTSYQEEMMRLALDRHFETEKANFCGRNFKIKTLALFFIDDISSYRTDKDGKHPYLLKAFERLLEDKLKSVINNLNDNEAEYRAYLQASLSNVSACHAGYFSQDNSDSDEDIAKEVDAILYGKKRLLSIKDSDGNYNPLRFLFSKWTLKEGWDNPNVFTIAKLRSSGSEISKLQEVGRGLRLPVDENGNRISNEEFQLNYIVDFTEADFAEKLIDQINGDLSNTTSITEEQLINVASKLGISSEDLFDELYKKNYIDRFLNIKPENRELFFEDYVGFSTGLNSGKILNRNVHKRNQVGIRKDVYEELRDLWEVINQRYFLFYDADLNAELKAAILQILEDEIFANVVITSKRDILKNAGNKMVVTSGTGIQYIVNRPIPYNVFLKRIVRATNIPINDIHDAICEYSEKFGNLDPEVFNETSVTNFIHKFGEWKSNNLQGRFKFSKSISSIGATALSYSDGSPRAEITQGRIGTKLLPGVPSSKYLYDTIVYDSQLEKRNIISDIDNIIVYGKIPRSSIAIPTITGGTYSPDFMYVVEKASGQKIINIIVETKDVENKNELRGEERIKIECAKIFFDMLKKDGYEVVFRNQLNNKEMAHIISEVISK